MAKERKDILGTGEAFDDSQLSDEIHSSVGTDENLKNGSTSEPVEPVGGFDWLRAFRYKPTQVTSDIIKTSCMDANLDRNDVVSVALFLLQIATEDQLQVAFDATFQSKARDLAKSLRGG